MNPLIIGNKKARLPIVQGGMGVGVSLSGLAGAVAKAGGVGVISAAQIGFAEPDFLTDCHAANLRALKKHIVKAKEQSKEGLVGVNIMTATKEYEAQVRAACETGADLIISGAGLPADLPEFVQNYASQTKIAPIVSSAKSARVILKLWDRHFHRTADMVVIEGPKAGGHLGFSPEQLARLTTEAYEQEIIDIISIIFTVFLIRISFSPNCNIVHGRHFYDIRFLFWHIKFLILFFIIKCHLIFLLFYVSILSIRTFHIPYRSSLYFSLKLHAPIFPSVFSY